MTPEALDQLLEGIDTDDLVDDLDDQTIIVQELEKQGFSFDD